MGAVTTIYLVRHGETIANAGGIVQGQSDTMLSENGMLQARMAAARLQKLHFDAIYSSDLSRAMTTARCIANGQTVIPAKELREWNLGEWQGLPLAEVKKRFPESYAGFLFDKTEFTIPGGESKFEIDRRVAEFADTAAKKHLGQQILLVTHGGVLRSFFRHALGIRGTLPRQPRTDNTGISCFLYFEEGFYQMTLWNDVSHLNSIEPCPW